MQGKVLVTLSIPGPCLGVTENAVFVKSFRAVVGSIRMWGSMCV